MQYHNYFKFYLQDWSPVVKHQCSGTILNRDSLQWNTKSTKLVVANQSNQVTYLSL
jgi:hypothetical protein